MPDDFFNCSSSQPGTAELAALRTALGRHRRPLQRMAQHYALLGGETRLKILALLERAGELCVCDLAAVLEMSPAAVSQHLSRLRAGRLVRSRRDGMTIYYRVTDRTAESDDLPAVTLPSLAEE